jgi:hypothetical protein
MCLCVCDFSLPDEARSLGGRRLRFNYITICVSTSLQCVTSYTWPLHAQLPQQRQRCPDDPTSAPVLCLRPSHFINGPMSVAFVCVASIAFNSYTVLSYCCRWGRQMRQRFKKIYEDYRPQFAYWKEVLLIRFVAMANQGEGLVSLLLVSLAPAQRTSARCTCTNFMKFAGLSRLSSGYRLTVVH